MYMTEFRLLNEKELKELSPEELGEYLEWFKKVSEGTVNRLKDAIKESDEINKE